MRQVAEQLFQAHYEEVAVDRHETPLCPHWDVYEDLEQRGMLLILAAWATAGAACELVGYAVTIIVPHLHYATTKVAQNDLIYVAPSHRRGRVGMELMHETEVRAREAGCKRVTWHAKPGTALEAILARRGYQVHETIYGRGL